MTQPTAKMSSTEKALNILMAFTPHNHPMGTLELSHKLGIHKSTVSRLLHLLADNGFVLQNSDTKKYILGRAAAEIGNAAMRSLNSQIVNIAQSHLNELCAAVGESVALEVISGTNVVLAYHCEGQGHVRFSFQLGELVPIHVAAGSKAIMAHSSPDFVDLCLQGKLKRFTKNTIVSKAQYRKLLKTVRETGLAHDNGERYEDTRAIAAPILKQDGTAVAAVVIAGTAFRLTPSFLKEVVAPLKETATEISQRLFP
jgi:IclR family acetate operon transcriptional repressor